LRPGTRAELLYLLLGATGLVVLAFVLPLADVPASSRVAPVAAYALVLTCVASLLHGSLLAARGYATSRLLAFGAAAAGLGVVLVVLLASPANMESASGSLLSFPLTLANLLRILAAASLGIALARYVGSVGAVLLIVAVATASDLYSVFAGPTRELIEENSPALNLLLLVFPSFGSALGFGLGVSDFIFLALFAAASSFLDLRYLATLVCLCLATALAIAAGLLLERPLPAIPFIALAFLLINADLILARLRRRS
jgi:hypothetical protein